MEARVKFPNPRHLLNVKFRKNFFTLFKFICRYITKPTKPNDANFACDELRNFPKKFGVKFTSTIWLTTTHWNCQVRSELREFQANFRSHLSKVLWNALTVIPTTCTRKTKVSSYHLKLTKISYDMYLQEKKEIWLVVYIRSNLIGVKYIHLSLIHPYNRS